MDVEGRHAFWTTMREFAARGKTILFATHYLEEADAYADRAVLMARGASSPTGPPTEIKAMVGTRTIRATLPDACARASSAGCPASRSAERRGEAVVLACTDSDTAIRALLAALPGRAATSRSAAPASRRRSSSSPATPRDEEPTA